MQVQIHLRGGPSQFITLQPGESIGQAILRLGLQFLGGSVAGFSVLNADGTATPVREDYRAVGGETPEYTFSEPDYLRAVGLGFLADPPKGEDITPSFIRQPEDLAPIPGYLPSLFRTPTLHSLRNTSPEGIQHLYGAGAKIGLFPTKMLQNFKSVTPSGAQGGSVLA